MSFVGRCFSGLVFRIREVNEYSLVFFRSVPVRDREAVDAGVIGVRRVVDPEVDVVPVGETMSFHSIHMRSHRQRIAISVDHFPEFTFIYTSYTLTD